MAAAIRPFADIRRKTMSQRLEYTQLNEAVTVTNDDASKDLVATPGSGIYVYIEKLNISVYEAAIGGGGVIGIIDTLGASIYKTNADGVKDISLDFGEEGLMVGP